MEGKSLENTIKLSIEYRSIKQVNGTYICTTLQKLQNKIELK